VQYQNIDSPFWGVFHFLKGENISKIWQCN
jgi:hypothetical protein